MMENESCYICGEPATTRDHVPPQAIFSAPKPTNLITVPACERCNHDSTLDDEYFRWFITTSSSDMTQAPQLVYDRIFPRAKKRPALLQSLMKGVRKVNLFTKRGVFVKQVPAFTYDKARIKTIVEKIVRGLYWNEKKESYNDKHSEIKFVFYPPSPNEQPPPPPKECQKVLLSSPLNKIGDGKTFAYHYYADPKDDRITIWLLLFFEITGFLVMTNPIDQP